MKRTREYRHQQYLKYAKYIKAYQNKNLLSKKEYDKQYNLNNKLKKSIQGKEYYKKNRDKIIKRTGEYYKKNYLYLKSKNEASRIKRAFNMTIEEVNIKKEKQKGLCKICKINKATHIDHNHKTGEVRGILCNICNSGLGFLKDDIGILKSAVKYLKEYD